MRGFLSAASLRFQNHKSKIAQHMSLALADDPKLNQNRTPEAAPLPHMIISFSACLCPKYVLEVPAHPCLCFISNACARSSTDACDIHGLYCADRGGGGEGRYAVRQCGRVVWALRSPSSKLGRADRRPFSRISFGGDRGAQCSLGWPGPFLGLFQHYMEQRATAVVVRA